MSIINDAIIKARKEFEIKSKQPVIAVDISKKENPLALDYKILAPSDIKWTVLVAVSLVVIISLLGSVVLYRHMSRLGQEYNTAALNVKSERSIPFDQLKRKAKVENMMQLNGIVYGKDDKWAIINDKIFREGDSILNGAVARIEKNYVKIEKNNGDEIVLDLK